jgi:hypothetical protein
MSLELDEEQTAALIKELSDITENDKYPFSPRIRMLREILSKLRPEPVCKPLPPPQYYATLRATHSSAALACCRAPACLWKNRSARASGGVCICCAEFF